MTSSSHGADAPSAIRATPGFSALLWLIGGLGAAGVFLWCLLVIPGTREAFPTGDGAVIELYTLLASRGWWEYGPYSRWGWHHPGPVFFYLVAPFYTASHSHSLAINAGTVAINLIAATAILWAIARHASVTLAVSVTAFLAMYLWRMPLLLVSAWNPHTVLLPMAALIVAASIAASGRMSLLPLTIGMASFVSQTHIGLLLPAAAVTVCALVAGLIAANTAAANTATARGTRGPRRGRWFWLGVSALIGFILWLPPIVEQVTNADGNLSKIVRFFTTPDPADPSAPFMQALRVWADALLAPLTPDLHFAVGGLLAREASTTRIALALFSVALLVAAGWRTRRGTTVDAWFCRICAVASLAAMLAMTGVRQGFGDYMVAWINVIGLMNGAALAAWLFTLLIALIARRRTSGAQSTNAGVRDKRIAWIVPLVTSVCLIATTVHGTLDLERLRAERNTARNGDRVRGESVYVALRAFLANARVRRPLIHVVGTWDNAAAIVLQLHKRHQPVAIDDSALWLIGPNFAKDGTEDAQLALADRSERHRVSAREGDCMLIERHGLSLHVLLPSLRTPIELTCE
jgi:hypothetical protein